MTRMWFKEKKGGYGLKPVRWEGWVATVILVALVLAAGYFTGAFAPHATVAEWFHFFFDTIVVIVLFYLFSKDKTER